MQNGDLSLLLKFAELIQQKIKIETNEKAKESLEKDLLIVKNEIGKRVLDIPNDKSIFPPFESSQFFDEKILDQNKETISSIACNDFQQSQKSISMSPINSPVRYAKPKKNQSLSELVDENDPETNFENNENQSVDEISIHSFPGQPNPFAEFTTDDIAAKFNQFIKKKESKKTKESRIPKPKSKIPVPKQK